MEEAKANVLEDIVLLRLVGMKTVVVHGGGPAGSQHQVRPDMEPEFVDGRRLNDDETREGARMVLVDDGDTDIVSLIHRHSGTHYGLTRRDGAAL